MAPIPKHGIYPTIHLDHHALEVRPEDFWKHEIKVTGYATAGQQKCHRCEKLRQCLLTDRSACLQERSGARAELLPPLSPVLVLHLRTLDGGLEIAVESSVDLKANFSRQFEEGGLHRGHRHLGTWLS